MLGLFNRKSKLKVLQSKYEKLLRQSHLLSTSNRAASDRKYAEAQDVLKLIDNLLAE